MPLDDALIRWVRDLAEREGTTVLGVSGAQGSGKSTLCAQLSAALVGRQVTILSIDDLYLTRAERQELGQAVHPLCAVRGHPGTHDVAMGLALLDALTTAGEQEETTLPRFDKSVDDRSSQGEHVVGRPDLILFEGWCVGAGPGADWAGPINERERRDDPDGTWNRWTERELGRSYLDLWKRLDALLFIEVSSFEAVAEGRCRQERAMAQHLAQSGALDASVGLMSEAQVVDYVALFERKTRQLLRELPQQADFVVKAWRPA